MLRGFGAVPAGLPAWLPTAVGQAKTAGDAAQILSRAWSQLMQLRDTVTNTYVGGKHEDEKDLAARKLQIWNATEAVRLQYAFYLQRLDQLQPSDPIPPDVAPLVREVQGFNVPTPMAFAPWVLGRQFDQLVSEAGQRIGGNLPKIPGGPTTDIGWLPIVALVALVWALSKTEFRVEL